MAKRLVGVAAGLGLATLLILAVFPVRKGRPEAPPRIVTAVRGSGTLVAGLAAVPLGAPPGVAIGGFPRFRYASQGVLDEPMARAVVLTEGALSVAVASVDVLLVPAALREKVESMVRDLGLSAVLVAATHTHAGPGGFWDDALGARFATGPHDPAWEAALAGRIADAVRAAAAARAPARLAVGSSRRPDLVLNRNGAASGGGLLVLRLERPDGEVAGQVVVFPAHPTTLGSDNRLLSADWPGVLARELPGVTVFLQGAEGDQTWARAPVGAAPARETFGRLVAGAVKEVALAPVDATPALGLAVARVTLPAPSFGAVPRFLDRLVANLLWNWMPERTDVAVLQVGPATLLAVPAEPGEAVGEAWRTALGPGTVVVSLVGDYVGYVETPERVRARTGEAVRTYLGPRLALVLGDGLVAAREALPPAPPAAR